MQRSLLDYFGKAKKSEPTGSGHEASPVPHVGAKRTAAAAALEASSSSSSSTPVSPAASAASPAASPSKSSTSNGDGNRFGSPVTKRQRVDESPRSPSPTKARAAAAARASPSKASPAKASSSSASSPLSKLSSGRTARRRIVADQQRDDDDGIVLDDEDVDAGPVADDGDDDGDFEPGDADDGDDDGDDDFDDSMVAEEDDDDTIDDDDDDDDDDDAARGRRGRGRGHARSRTQASPSKPPQRSSSTSPSRSPSRSSSGSSLHNIITLQDKKREKDSKFKEKNVERYQWLLDIRDAERRRPGDDGYDPSTLYVPPAAYSKMTAFEQQFWDVKSKHFDTVVFFKKGKFYELYEGDADIASKEFDLKMTDRVNMRMAGVPESSFSHWASKFLALGYKITKVDQAESSLALAKRKKDKGSAAVSKTESIIQREVSQILTVGTLVDPDLIPDYRARLLLAVREVDLSSDGWAYACCFVDCAVGEFQFASLVNDNNQRTQLETLLVQLRPAELLIEKGQLSPVARQVISRVLPGVLLNARQFGSSATEAESLLESYRASAPTFGVPESLQSSPLAPDFQVTLAALVSYLKELKIDTSVVGSGSYSEYRSTGCGDYMVLDGQTLMNLEVLENNHDRSSRGTLLQFVDRCQTPFGKRLLCTLLCRPLANVRAINDRLDAIENLNELPDLMGLVSEQLRQLPDLERIVSKIVAATTGERSSTATLNDLIKALNGFDVLWRMFEDVRRLYGSQVTSPLLQSLLGLGPFSSTAVTLQEPLAYFAQAFDRVAAAKTGTIDARDGVDPEYDGAMQALRQVEQTFHEHLVAVRKSLRDPSISYAHKQKEKYQLEISRSNLAHMTLPNDYQILSETKQVKRFWNSTIKRLLPTLEQAEENVEFAKEGLLYRYLSRFAQSKSEWKRLVQNAATLDVLLSLSKSSFLSGVEQMCRPQFVESEHSQLRVTDMRHPLVCTTMSNFVPNDLDLGTETSPGRIALLTGPNMGGKSTLLRQCCILVILAQVGCYVPAASCTMSIIDRIFTRIGASDNIFTGQSTFMVELQETNNVLKHATPRSLVILDELGRGTSTYDGYAIAYAVLEHLIRHIGCATLFSTHYHMLTDEFANNPNVSLKHMSCIVDDEQKQVVYLYKIAPGVCPKSHGMSVALTAGLQQEVVDSAYRAADNFELASYAAAIGGRKQAVRKLCALIAQQPGDAAAALERLKAIQIGMERVKLT